MNDTDKFVLPDGDFADRCACHDRTVDHAGRTERRERARALADRPAASAVPVVRRYAVAVSRHRTCTIVSTLDHPPIVGPLRAAGRDLTHALTELRFAYAMALVRVRLLPSSDEARAYALNAEFYPAVDGSRIQVQVY